MHLNLKGAMSDKKDEALIQLGSENNQLRVLTDKRITEDWNELMTADETLEFLDFHTVLSFYSLLKFCQVISECKRSWPK